MENNLFDIVNSKMFSVFNGKDRRSNFDLLNTIYDIFNDQERKQNLLKDTLIDDLSAYINGREFDEFDDSEENEINQLKTSKDKATLKIRKYKDAGWLEFDSTDGFETMVSLNDNAIILLQTFKQIIDNKNHPLEYTGYFYSIYSLLKEFEYKESKARIEQIKKNTKELFASLQGLNSSIKRFIEEMINKPNMKPQDVLDTLLYKYQDQVMLTVFNNLKAKDNPSKYTSEIIKKLNEIRFNRIDDAVVGYLSSLGWELTKDNYNNIQHQIENDLDDVVSRFQEVDMIVSTIDNKNSKFHSSALSVLEFLLNNRRDVEGKIVNALKVLKNIDEKEPLDDLIDIFTIGNIDDKSLYTRTFNKEKTTYIKSEIPSINIEEVNEDFNELIKEDAFSKKNVNLYVKELLKNKDRINTEEILIESIDDVIMILMIEIYSEYEEMEYIVTFSNIENDRTKYSFKNFEIMRK